MTFSTAWQVAFGMVTRMMTKQGTRAIITMERVYGYADQPSTKIGKPLKSLLNFKGLRKTQINDEQQFYLNIFF